MRAVIIVCGRASSAYGNDLVAFGSLFRVSERADGKKLIKQLEDLQYRWTSEFMRLQDNYRKRKISLPEFPYVRGIPQIRPAAALVATYEKKFVR